MAKILVIGRSGQLASEFNDIKQNFSQHILNFLGQNEVNLLEIKHLEESIVTFEPHFIINCAAYTAVDKAESDIHNAEKINILGAKNLSNICRSRNIHLVHISTDFVYDGLKPSPYLESDSVSPLSIYGLTKWKGEQAILDSNCSFTILRTSWLYSAFGNNFVKTMLRLGVERETLNVVYDQVGTPTYARDLAEFILIHIVNFPKYDKEIYHYSNEGVASWYDFAYEIMSMKRLKCQVLPIFSSQYPTPAKRPSFSVMDKSKLKTHYSCTLPHWKDSLSQCIQRLQD